MRRRQPYDFGAMALAGLIAMAGAIVIGLILSSLAKPDQMMARLAKLGLIEQRAAKLEARPGDPAAYPAHAVCDSPTPDQSEELRRQVAALASGAGLTASTVSAMVTSADQPGVLTPIKLQFSVTGRYDAALAMLDALARVQPAVFVESVDIKTQASNIDLKFAGSAYCWTSDPR